MTNIRESTHEAPDGTAASKPRPMVHRRQLLARGPLWLLVVLPFGLSLAEAIRSPRLNYYDYWLILGLTTKQDGSLNWPELFHLYHEHPIATVGLAFWADAKLFAANQWILGVFTVLMGAAIFASLWSMLPARLTGARRVAVLAALSMLLFSSAATEYYGLGWMGVQWFLGIAPAIVAIAFAHRGKTVPAVLFAALGSLGHGCAFPVWIALAVIAWLRRERLWRLVLPFGFGVVVFAAWRLVPGPDSYPPPAILGADSYLGSMFTSIGRLWSVTSVDLAMLAGVVTTAVFVLLGASVVARRRFQTAKPADGEPNPETAGWFGLAVQVVLMAAMIGISRGNLGNAEGLAPRYAIIGLLGGAALVVLLVSIGPRLVASKTIPVVLIIGIGTYAVGSSTASETRKKYPEQPVLGVAMQVGAHGVVEKMNGYPGFLPLYKKMGVYPFTDDFTLGCHGPELGDKVDLGSAAELPAPAAGQQTAGALESGPVVGDTEITGWAMIDAEQADCVVVADAEGTIVGGGAVGLPRIDVTQVVNGTGRAGWKAVAKPGTTGGVVLLKRGDMYYRVSAMAGANTEGS